MESAPRGNSARLISLALWLGALTVLGYHLAVEVTSIRLPEPMGLWETTYAALARIFPHGYQSGNFVLGHDNYGPGYPAYCRAFLAVIPDVYVACRVANLVALALASGLLACLLRQNRASAAVTAAVVAVYFALNAGSYSIQARPDFLVLLLITGLLAVGQAVVRGRIRPALAGTLLGVLALAADLTKPYSLFAWGAALVALAACRGVRPALIAGAVSAALLGAGIAAYAHANPYYLLETFHAHVAHTDPDFRWLLHQSGDFALLACGLVLAAAVGGAARLRAHATREAPNPGDLDRRYWGIITALAVLALGGALGWHTGAYLTYYFHLLLVPLCVFAVAVEADGSGTGLCLLANLAVLMAVAPAIPKPDPGWADLSRDVLAQPGPVVVDTILEPLARLRPEVRVADTGMVRYALDEPALIGPQVAGQAAALSEARSFGGAEAGFLARHPPAALYLDFASAPNPQGPPGALVYSPRNGLPWFSAEFLAGYTAVRHFRLHPYYAATNERRQNAGTWETLVIKFVPKPVRKSPAP